MYNDTIFFAPLVSYQCAICHVIADLSFNTVLCGFQGDCYVGVVFVFSDYKSFVVIIQCWKCS